MNENQKVESLVTTQATAHTGQPEQAGHGGHGGHGWMMMACCIPMLVIGVALVVTGVVSPSFLLLAVACTAMMALMMRGMSGTGSGSGSGGQGHQH